MIHLIPISGGKDSQATAIWFAVNNNDLNAKVILIFCDTGNESQVTYEFIEKTFVPTLPRSMQNLVIVKNKRGETLLQQAVRKKRFPSTKARFCTTELKVEPMIDFILQLKESCKIYDGRRHEESPQRANLSRVDEYFSYYYEPRDENGKRKTLYRRKDVLNWLKSFDADVVRPVLTMTTKEIFEFISINNYSRNPLYDKGFNRVGCFPCIMCSFGEIIRVAEEDPEKIEEIRQIEIQSKTTFFGPNKIPVRFCKTKILNDKNELVGAPTILEVIEYAKTRGYDDGLFGGGACFNNFVKCE